MRQFPENEHTTNQTRTREQRASAAALASERPGRRLALRRLGLHKRFLPLLVAVTLLSTVFITICAYFGARADAITAAQAQAAQDVRVERQLLAAQGGSITLNDNHLQVGVDASVLVLNGDTSFVDHTRLLLSAHVTIYQLEGNQLIAIATNLPMTNRQGKSISGTRALGDVLSGAAMNALLGACGPTDTTGCHRSYQGVVEVRGISYVAAYAPLYDASGAFVGALSAAIPLDQVVAPTVQLIVLLVFVGLLAALISLVVGYWAFGRLSRNTLDALDIRLLGVAATATELGHTARAQATRTIRQGQIARQASEYVRSLNALAGTMARSHDVLQQSAGDVWNEMSQPGLPPDPTATARLARQATVTMAHVGSAAKDATDLCSHLITLINRVIAEGTVVAESGHEMEQRAQELRDAVEHVEVTVGERLVHRSQGLLSLPLLRRMGQRSGRSDQPGNPLVAQTLGEQKQEPEEEQLSTGKRSILLPPSPHTGTYPRQGRYQQRTNRTLGDTASGPAYRDTRDRDKGNKGNKGNNGNKGNREQGGQLGASGSAGQIRRDTDEWHVPPSSQSRAPRSPDGRGKPAPSRPHGNAGSGSFDSDSLHLPRLPDDDPGEWNRRLLDDGDNTNTGNGGDSSSGSWPRG